MHSSNKDKGPAHSERTNAALTKAALVTSLVVAILSNPVSQQTERIPPRSAQVRRAPRSDEAALDLPDDPTLPALAEIRAASSAGTILAPGLGDCPIEFILRGYTPGSRATLEARAGDLRVAVKVYADDPAPEAELYESLASAGLAGDSGVRVPPLLAWERGLRVLIIGWLEGPTAHELVKGGQGARAGELAAAWLRRAASLPVRLGPPFGAARVLEMAETWVATLASADAALGSDAAALAGRLARTQPKEHAPRLVHGTMYARHVLDLGDGPGVIDWQRFGQGPLELDAGIFLATVSRLALRHEPLAGEVARAEEALRAGTRNVLDERALAWYQSVTLLRLAAKPVGSAGEKRLLASGKPDLRNLALSRAQALLDQAARLAAAAC